VACAAAASLALLSGCKKPEPPPGPLPQKPLKKKVGLVTDIGGRGDHSFNDGALRGLETWAAGARHTESGYEALSAAEVESTVGEELKRLAIKPLQIEPIVKNPAAATEFEPSFQSLVSEGATVSIGVGFLLENAVEAAAKKNPKARFVLIDSPILDEKGATYTLSNVRTVAFRDQEGGYLMGALAGLIAKGKGVGFVGGMDAPVIRRIEAGFRAGLATTNPEAAKGVQVAFTGSFDKPEEGKRAALALLEKGAGVLFHAAGGDGSGVIAAAAEKGALALGCDSDQNHLAPNTVVSSMLKRVDVAVYLAARHVASGVKESGHLELGIKDGGIGFAPLRGDGLADREALTRKLAEIEKGIADGTIVVPAELAGVDEAKRP
jgi:basic membrane protein A